MADFELQKFTKGVHNLYNPEIIPGDAAQDAYNWVTLDGVIELARGRNLVHDEGTQGKIQGEGFGYTTSGSVVHYRKTGTKVQYDNGTTWVDIITGLTNGYDMMFVNYSSLAGNFTFGFSLDGIYKMNNANPGSYVSLYNASKNFKFTGAIIDKGRCIAWGNAKDKTGLYLSYIDTQKVGTVYTQVTNETIGSGNGVLVTFTGTLAFKGGGATRNAFALTITDSVETFTDNYNGTLTGSLGGTGTINYTSGAFSVTFNTAPANTPNNIKATYLWEDSNASGLTDFSKSDPRTTGQGAIIRQDEGGDAIMRVNVGLDGSYYSMKQRSVYQLTLDNADVSPTNVVFRREIGIMSLRGSISTQNGIVFMNTANLEKPELTILQRNPVGGEIEPVILFPQFKFANYRYDDATLETYGQFIVLSCKTPTAVNNDTVLLLDVPNKKVDITGYNGRTFVTDGTDLFMGSSITQTVYKIYSGFDDDGAVIPNYWTGKDEMFKSENLKKVKYLRLKGNIQKSQSYEVYIDYDKAGFQLVGTIIGTGTYVDVTSPQTIGSNMIGVSMIGGDSVSIVYPYFTQLKIKTPKFRKRTIKLVALGYGYVSVETMMDRDILGFENKLPKRFRQKNYVSLDGETTGNPEPEF